MSDATISPIKDGLAKDAPLHLPSMTVGAVDNGLVRVELSGAWVTRGAGVAEKRIAANPVAQEAQTVIFDLSEVQLMDTAGAWLVTRQARALVARGVAVDYSGVKDAHAILLDAMGHVSQDDSAAAHAPKGPNIVIRSLATIGRLVHSGRRDLTLAMHIIGAALTGAQMKEGQPNRVSWAPLISQMDRMGVRAVPIIALMAFIIGAIIAQQGAFQLRYFGAEIFVVDLVSILVLREIGVLITAIMIAGRSGSAITAEIGSMRMREEIDALTVIGLNPVAVLVFPRLVALMIALPLLTFMANLAALLGAMIVADLYSGISYASFIARLQASVDMSSLVSGLIKAPVMALIIALVASIEGLKVGGSAESLGRQVTASVVKAIFLVIVVDGFFAIFFAAIDF